MFIEENHYAACNMVAKGGANVRRMTLQTPLIQGAAQTASG
jgi:hypothetical protein